MDISPKRTYKGQKSSRGYSKSPVQGQRKLNLRSDSTSYTLNDTVKKIRLLETYKIWINWNISYTGSWNTKLYI